MLGKVICAILFALLVQGIQCQGPPKVTGSYIAWGELTSPVSDLQDAEMQIAFEETYDDKSQNAAFVVWIGGKNVTFVENFKTNQTFRYTEGEDCVSADKTEWIKSKYPPALLTYEEKDGGVVKFSLRQLFGMPDRYLDTSVKQGDKSIFRGIPAKKWVYKTDGVEPDERQAKRKLFITAYWSDNLGGAWNTSSNAESIPLGFHVNKTSMNAKYTVEETTINVFGYISGAYDHKYFEPFQGIVCVNRTKSYEFPNVKNIKAISLHSEMILPDYQEIKYIDTWYDPQNQLLRVDVERIKEENPMEEIKEKRYESEMALRKMGVVYRLNYWKGLIKCDVIPFSNYENDVQNFIDIKQDPKKWTMGKLFGLNDTNYIYTGKTTKADVPCHVFQGIRKDWPETSAKVTSLWEWCFNVNMSKEGETVQFRNNEFGLINAQVTILESDKPMDYPPGFRMFHHFYQVAPENPDILDATTFDISQCYNYSQRRYLQFYLDWNVTKDNIHIAENLTSNVQFLQIWKSAIYKHSGLPDYSLRVSTVRSTIADKKLYIRFLILGIHENLPSGIKATQIEAFKAESNLRDNVNAGKVSIFYTPTKGAERLEFKVAKHSVTMQINPEIKKHTLPPLPTTTSTESTKYVFSLITDPNDRKSSVTNDEDVTDETGSKGPGQRTTIPTKIDSRSKETRHPPGTVAAVSIAMLLVGISVGSAGTFYKFFGLPSCLRGQT